MWNNKNVKEHLQAAEALEKIKNQAFEFIALKQHDGITEYDVQQFILAQFRIYKLRIDKWHPIVGFNGSAAIPHYFPQKSSAKKLKPNSLILIDIWSRFKTAGAPFADITWVGYYGGKIPQRILDAAKVVFEARDAALALIKHKLPRRQIPTGAELDEAANIVIKKSVYKKYILHRTGHVLGFASPHGRGRNINPTNVYPILQNTGYTIEPGIYVKGQFGIRSEINFLITKDYKLRVTTPVQKKLIYISNSAKSGK